MLRTSIVASALLCAAAWWPARAEACGGTFCDGGATPVAQTGETVLFVMTPEGTEAHIQIAYDPNTDANQFAWVVPLLAVPEFSVGSQPLFDRLLASTVPAYGFSSQFDDCDLGGRGDDDGNGDGIGDGGVKFDAGADDGGPDVVLQQLVGAFEITVLQGGTAAEVMQWLGDNGYEQDPAAEPILAEYLAENYLFAAFKLVPGADTSEIHPVVLSFPTTEACVPLRLTRIAAQEDMGVRTFFLAESRMVPQNYKHVLVNPLLLDWPSSASNYQEVITLAVDAFGADGKAFVTEYAGPSSVVGTGGVYSEAWDPSVFADVDVLDVVTRLADQDLMSCTIPPPGGACFEQHPLLRGLLLQYLPPPPDVPPETFWGCLTCYADEIDSSAWDGAAFAAALEQRIVAPGAHAAELLAAHPYLTRMYTTISPAEMTEDPFFQANPDLDDVSLVNEIATRRTLCNGDNLWTLPDGREVYVPAGSGWPDFDDEMPWEEEVSRMPPAGAPMVIADRRAEIRAVLDAYNCSHGWPTRAICGLPEDPASDESGAWGDGGESDRREVSGCGCGSEPSERAWYGLFPLVFLARMRARRSA